LQTPQFYFAPGDTNIFTGPQSKIAQAVVNELNSRLAPQAKRSAETEAKDIEISPGLFRTLFYAVVVGDRKKIANRYRLSKQFSLSSRVDWNLPFC
jgi:hypothetical protein